MHPEIALPGIGLIRSHGLFVGLAAVVAATVGVWSARREGLPLGRVVGAVAILAVVVFAGGRLHFALTKWHLFAADPSRLLRFSSGGLHAPGAILAGAVGGGLALRALGLPVLRFADAFAPAVGVGIGIARIGCFLNGCCFGVTCAYPWAVSFGPDTAAYLEQIERGVLRPGAAGSLPVHPLPLYFAAAAFAMAGFLVWLQPRKRFDGHVVLWLLFLFSVSSALLEPLRGHHSLRVYWAGEPQLLWVSGAVALVTALVLLKTAAAARTG